MNEPPSQSWFEMADLRRRRFANSVWVPLRAAETVSKTGTTNRPGHSEEMFCSGCVAIPIERRAEGEQLKWMDIGLIHSGGPFAFSGGGYKACEIFQNREGEDLGVDLVFEQHVGGHPRIWHVSQDLVLALNLLQEGDTWVRPDEGYIEVVRQRRDVEGRVVAIEIRSEFLRDYLAARGMALRLAYYRQRMAVLDDPSHLRWPPAGLAEEQPHDRFQTRLFEIDAHGGLFDAGVAIFETWRTDIDPDEDVPIFGPEDETNTAGRSAVYSRSGPKFFRAEGELWREEWIEPADRSERVRGDEPPDSISFVVDNTGKREPSTALYDECVGRYLWFDPKIISALSDRRGGGIGWYTQDTGSVWCSPGWPVHFGVNRLGLVNVYAYDIAKLPYWQQRIWAGQNVTPDGAVSAELLDAQMRTRPARTRAPEAELRHVMKDLDNIFREHFGGPLFRAHDAAEGILGSVHRFRAVDRNGLLALAKDIARLTADSIDIGTLRRVLTPPKSETWGSLKSLEKVVATIVSGDQARSMLTPLVGAYELRLGDAHLPSNEIDRAFEMANIDLNTGFVEQGRQLLSSVVNALRSIHDALLPSMDRNSAARDAL